MKRKEISQAIRSISKKEKCKCYMCQTKKNVQNHHVIKVENLTHIAWKNNLHNKEEIESLYIPTIPLCEKCHIKMHSLMEDNYLEPEVDYDFFTKVFEILEQIDLSEVSEELYEDYSSVVKNMTNTVVFNLLEYGEFTEEEIDKIQEILVGKEEEYEQVL